MRRNSVALGVLLLFGILVYVGHRLVFFAPQARRPVFTSSPSEGDSRRVVTDVRLGPRRPAYTHSIERGFGACGHAVAVAGDAAQAVSSAFEAALEGEFSKRVFGLEKTITAQPGAWLAASSGALLATATIREGQTCHADGFFNEFVGVVDPEARQLLSGVHHVCGDGATRRALWGDDQVHLLYVTHAGGQGYFVYEAVVLTFSRGAVDVQTVLKTQESRDLRIEASASGEALLVLRRRPKGGSDIVKAVAWDGERAAFVPSGGVGVRPEGRSAAYTAPGPGATRALLTGPMPPAG